MTDSLLVILSAQLTYVGSLVGCLCAAHVLLTILNLRAALVGEKDQRTGDMITRRMADNLQFNEWPWIAHVVAGVLMFVAASSLRRAPLSPDLTLSVLFAISVVIGTVRGRGKRENSASRPATPAPPSTPLQWRSYRWPLVVAAFGLLLMLVVHWLRSYSEFVGEPDMTGALIVAAVWVLGAWASRGPCGHGD